MPDFGLAQTPNFANAALAGFQAGKEQRRARDQEAALKGYFSNPEDDVALTNLASANPTLGVPLMEQRRKRKEKQEIGEIAALAQAGDRGAMSELLTRDADIWSKLDTQQKDKMKQATGFLGQAALQISGLREEDRAAAWTSYVQRAEASGLDIPTQYETYSPQALNAVAAEAEVMEKIIKRAEPDWRFSPNGGLVDFNSAESIKGYSDWLSKGGTGEPPSALPPDFDFGGGGPTQPASGGFPSSG